MVLPKTKFKLWYLIKQDALVLLEIRPMGLPILHHRTGTMDYYGIIELARLLRRTRSPSALIDEWEE
jgi:hypothetical protein